MEPLDRESAKRLFEHHRKHREGIHEQPMMAQVCLICGSIHIVPLDGNNKKLVCRNCGFAFYRYDCCACGTTIDGRDPQNPSCPACGEKTCVCGACGCPTLKPRMRT
jgi:NAD-dependent SIR2 family protein deacetylase